MGAEQSSTIPVCARSDSTARRGQNNSSCDWTSNGSDAACDAWFEKAARYLDEAHADGAHLGELVDDLEAVVDGLGEQLGEQLVVEDLEAAAARDLAHGGGVEAMLEVAVAALDEDAAVAQALGVHLAAHVVQV